MAEMYKISVVIFWLIGESIQFKNTKQRPADVGALCMWEGVIGNCINYWTCVTNAIDSLHGKYPPVCSFEGNEMMSCCTSCHIVANISSTVLIEGQLFEKNNKKSHDNCLDFLKQYGRLYECSFTAFGIGDFVKTYNKEDNCVSFGLKGNRGVGGKDARRAEYPHMALLGYGEDQESAQWQCGGSIISEWYILTAGHCRSNRVGEVQFIALGILKRSDPPSLWQVYRVGTFIPHPEYRPPSKYHDIALIRTDRRIEFSHVVLPACLPQGDETDNNVKVVYATGWGSLGYRRSLADVLQKVRVNSFSSEECSKQYGPHRHQKYGFHNTTQMCYGDSNLGRDTCEGDSGGPLQIDEHNICPQIIVGVTSSGHPCGFTDTAGLYTRVVHYRPWIEDIVWP